jgi:sugar/nucleoside kinase (ribokinase family)
MNETESGMISGIPPRDSDGAVIPENIERICRDLFSKGVTRYVVVHCPEAGFMMRADGKFITVPSLVLPDGYIQGTVGAGDAFCAGILYSVYRDEPPVHALRLASLCAAANLSGTDSIGGMRTLDETARLEKQFSRGKIK